MKTEKQSRQRQALSQKITERNPSMTKTGTSNGKFSLSQKRHFRKALVETLLLPVLVLAFFLTAPHWYAAKVHNSINNAIHASAGLSFDQKIVRIAILDKIDLQSVCLNCPAGLEGLHDDFEKSGICGTFEMLHWGLVLSLVLVTVLVMVIAAILILNFRAKQSPNELIKSYRLSWNIVMAAAIGKVILLIPLLVYGSFELMVLPSDRYYPSLLFFIILGGSVALWNCIRVLLRKVPLEFVEPISREVTTEEAPELWQAVKTAAERLETAPPDRIILGMKLNFYVAELAIKTNSGRVQGRMLFLSHPLLKQLSVPEVMAIIGHELGHFRGEDTRMTRDFYPRNLKVNRTIMGLAQSGFIGRPSLGLLNFFALCFENTMQNASRSRELLADQIGAALTSPETLARALVKFQVLNEAFNRGLMDAVTNEEQSPFDIGWRTIVEEKLAPEDPFWTQLFEKKLPHPLDSHPSLHRRLEALGTDSGLIDARTVALEETESAYATWFSTREQLFSELSRQAETAIETMRDKTHFEEADYKTHEGKVLLDKYFPQKKWGLKPSLLWSWLAPQMDELSLTVEGITYTNWKRPLFFEEVSSTVILKTASNTSLIFHLKEKSAPRGKWGIPIPNKLAEISLARVDGKPIEVAQTVYRYFMRQL